MPPLDGRVALVTGSSGRGMGRSIALTLARDGCDLIINYGTHRTDPAPAQRVANAIEDLGRRALVAQASIAQSDEVKQMIERAMDTFGRLDILVNNAGGAWQLTDLPAIDDDHWRAVVHAEIDGTFFPTKYALPHMRAQQWGRIINICGYRNEAWIGPPYDYMVGKVARLQLTRQLVDSEAQYGITINAICPGRIGGVAFDDALSLVKGEDAWRERPRSSPQDTAEVVAFLCSEAARFVSGSMICLPGVRE